AGTLIDKVQGSGAMEVVADFAEPLCYTAVQKLVGATDLELSTITRWARGIGATFDPLGGAEEAAGGQQIAQELSSYFRSAIGERRKSPRDDLLSSMLAVEQNGARFTEELILGSLIQIMQSPDSMTMQIANAVLALIRHPDQLALLQQDPRLI